MKKVSKRETIGEFWEREMIKELSKVLGVKKTSKKEKQEKKKKDKLAKEQWKKIIDAI